MNELIKQLDETLKDRRVTDGDGTIDPDTLRLMELRTKIELADQVETLNRRLTELTQMIRNKM
jgi:hypothetical protein